MTISRHSKGAQVAGQKTGGQFKAGERTAASGAGLGAPLAPVSGEMSEPDLRRFEQIRDTPTQEDFDATLDTIASDISNASFPSGPDSWDRVIGPKARRTAKNREQYLEHLAKVASEDPVWREKHHRYAKVHAELHSFERAWRAGVPVDPRSDAYFEEEWANPESNHGEQGTRRELIRIREMRAQLERGEIKPSAVIGTGYRSPKQLAFEYLEGCEARAVAALETRGRSHTVLASNALYRERLALANHQQGASELV